MNRRDDNGIVADDLRERVDLDVFRDRTSALGAKP